MRLPALAKVAAVLGLVSTYLLTGCQPQDEQQALELLARARQAEKNVTLEGQVETRLARPEGIVQAQAQVKHTPQRTVVKFTEGPAKGKEIVREAGKGYQQRDPTHPKARPLLGMMTEVPPLGRLTKNYKVELGPETDIAGRRVRQVTIHPRKGRSGQSVSLWIDVETGFPLGRERRDAFGRVVYSVRYLRVKYGPGASSPTTSAPPQVAAVPSAPGARPPAPSDSPPAGIQTPRPPAGAPAPAPGGQPETAPPPSGARPGAEPRKLRPRLPARRDTPGQPDGQRPHGRVVSPEQLGQVLGFTVTPPSFVPEGFTLRRTMLTREGGRGTRGILHFSDDVTALTVMVGRRQDIRQRLPTDAEAAGGAAVVQRPRGSFAMAVRGDAVYLVFGPLPDDTLQRIAASIP